MHRNYAAFFVWFPENIHQTLVNASSIEIRRKARQASLDFIKESIIIRDYMDKLLVIDQRVPRTNIDRPPITGCRR